MEHNTMPVEFGRVYDQLSPVNKIKIIGKVAIMSTKYKRGWAVLFFGAILGAVVFAISRDPWAAAAAALAGFLFALWVVWR